VFKAEKVQGWAPGGWFVLFGRLARHGRGVRRVGQAQGAAGHEVPPLSWRLLTLV